MTGSTENQVEGYGAQQLVERMGEAAANFLASLSTDQRARAIERFDEQESRTEWHYTPHPRGGIPFTEMDRNQQRLAQKLITTGLSRAGYVVASTIMGLETTLDAKEEWSSDLWWRDSRLYHLVFFGAPHESQPWGWRFEGHHISLNYTIVGGQIVSPTPTFFGSNPASAPLGVSTWLRPLGATEDLARDLVRNLDDGQRHLAVLTEVAPPDIVSLNRPFVVDHMFPSQSGLVADPPGVVEQYATMEHFMAETGVTANHLEAVRYSAQQAKGIAANLMSVDQREMLRALVGEYLHRMPDELAEIELKRIQARGIDHIHFAWAGALEPGAGHYYRLQGPRFLVEYDNIQNDANHIHSVWRDPENDFGRDVLGLHYAHDH